MTTATTTDRHAEVLVLGGGPGGYTAAFRAADLGCDVVLVDARATLGGVCLNVGCIPSKALLHAAGVLADARAMGAHGIHFGAPSIDLDAVRSWKDGVVGRLTGGLAGLARRRRVGVVVGTGRFTDPHTLLVTAPDGTTSTIGFDTAIIAVGSEPVRLPGVPHDDPRVLDSTGALAIERVPERLLIVGGGIVGLEMGTVYSELGSRVSVAELADQLVPGADPDLVAPLAARLAGTWAAIWTSTEVTGVQATPTGLAVSLSGDDAPPTAEFDAVLVAVGRRPNGAGVGAEAAGVHVDERGFIPVDVHQRTGVPHIYAVGDVVGGPMLAHKATHEGRVAAENAAGGSSAFDATVIPAVAYTDPEIAWVGLTETAAARDGIAYETGSVPWAASGRSLSLGRDEGLTKIVVEKGTGRLLGCGIVGPSASELISEAALAIELGALAADVGLTVHPHPTLSETLGQAADAFEGTLTDLYLPRT